MSLNPTLVAMFIFSSFNETRVPLIVKDDTAQERIDFNVAGGGEIECADWIRELAIDIVEECDETFTSKEGPGIWYYEVAEVIGAKIANDANEGLVYQCDIVKFALEQTTSWVNS